jgi:hypothetical protein
VGKDWWANIHKNTRIFLGTLVLRGSPLLFHHRVWVRCPPIELVFSWTFLVVTNIRYADRIEKTFPFKMACPKIIVIYCTQRDESNMFNIHRKKSASNMAWRQVLDVLLMIRNTSTGGSPTCETNISLELLGSQLRWQIEVYFPLPVSRMRPIFKTSCPSSKERQIWDSREPNLASQKNQYFRNKPLGVWVHWVIRVIAELTMPVSPVGTR